MAWRLLLGLLIILASCRIGALADPRLSVEWTWLSNWGLVTFDPPSEAGESGLRGTLQ